MQTVRVRTTQNVFIDQPLASVGDRILAYLVDNVIVVFYIIALGLILSEIDVEWFVWVILVGLPWLVYRPAFEILMNGQTPGKRVMNIQVTRLDGTPPTIGNYLLRWMLSPVDFLFSGLIAILCIVMGGKGQRLGDIVADTTVTKLVKQEEITARDVFVTPERVGVVTFNEVAQLNDKDIELIRRTLDVVRTQGNHQPATRLAEKIKERLGIVSNLATVDFLNTIIQDYAILNANT